LWLLAGKGELAAQVGLQVSHQKRRCDPFPEMSPIQQSEPLVPRVRKS